MLPLSLLAGGLSGTNSSTDAGPMSSSGSQQAGYTTSHVINDNGTGFNASPLTILLYVGGGILVLFLVIKLFRK